MGQDHVVALTKVGEVYCWGNGSKGQLGNGIKDHAGQLCNEFKPTKVESLSSEHITQIAVVRSSTFALSTSGSVYAWGDNHDNTLGLEDSTRVYVPQPMQLSLLGELRVRRLEVFEGRTIIAHVRAPEGEDEDLFGDFDAGPEERDDKELEVFTGIDQMRKAMEKTQEWWNHMLNIRHGQPYDMPHDAAAGVGQEAGPGGQQAAGGAQGSDVQDDMSAELSKLQKAERHLDSLVKLAVQELRETQRMPGTRNVRFILCMFIDECRLRREKVMRTISARQLVDAKRRTQEISAYSVIDFGANANEEIRKIIAVTKQLQQMLDAVRGVQPVDVLSLELKVTLMECLECKLQLHDTRVELLKEVKGKPSDPMLPALRTIKDRWNALKSFSLYSLYMDCEAKRLDFGGNDDEHLAYLVKASNAQIDQMLQIDKDRIISHDTLVPALCYDLLRENAELRKMTNAYQLRVLLLYKGARPTGPTTEQQDSNPASARQSQQNSQQAALADSG
mmetsp:Transcript_98533/g.287427  ORF Transcript_98533/g.287427 Transcript_98533/m.287427 type:complete len:504 (-) Transcript_98533:128-1639(-)